MSQYTTQLRWIIENSTKPGTVTERCTEAAPKIFNFNFPFYDESKRLDFEVMFLRHYYMQEICAETAGLWKLFLEDWLNVNMPYWNLKLVAINEKFSFLDAYDYNENYNMTDNTIGKGDTTNNTTGKTEVDSNGNSMQKYYEVPSKNIVSIDEHLNNATSVDSANTDTTNSNVDGTTNYNDNTNRTIDSTLNRKGRNGQSPSKLMQEYFEAIQNVNAEMLRAMGVLFMQVW